MNDMQLLINSKQAIINQIKLLSDEIKRLECVLLITENEIGKFTKKG